MSNLILNARSLYIALGHRFTYDETYGWRTIPELFANSRGVCCDFARIYYSLLRGIGWPEDHIQIVRAPVYDNSDNPLNMDHAWVEIKRPESLGSELWSTANNSLETFVGEQVTMGFNDTMVTLPEITQARVQAARAGGWSDRSGWIPIDPTAAVCFPKIPLVNDFGIPTLWSLYFAFGYKMFPVLGYNVHYDEIEPSYGPYWSDPIGDKPRRENVPWGDYSVVIAPNKSYNMSYLRDVTSKDFTMLLSMDIAITTNASANIEIRDPRYTVIGSASGVTAYTRQIDWGSFAPTPAVPIFPKGLGIYWFTVYNPQPQPISVTFTLSSGVGLGWLAAGSAVNSTLYSEYNISLVSPCDSYGNYKCAFSTQQAIYIKGSGFAPSTSLPIYMVLEGKQLLASNAAFSASKITNSAGSIPTSLLYSSISMQGTYNLWVDADKDGIYDESEPINQVRVASLTITLTPNHGYVDTVVTLSGTGATPGGQVQAYWDSIASLPLNSTYALGDGAYSFSITIPFAPVEPHYVLVKDVSTCSTASAPFSVSTMLRMSPNIGPVGIIVTITGSPGRAPIGGQIQAYWDSLAGSLLNSTYALGNGAFELKATIPAAIAGTHNIIIRDIASGTSTSLGFTVVPKITLLPTSGVPGDMATVMATGFGASKGLTLNFNNSPMSWTTTNSVGSATFGFIVPSVAYGTYAVNATDDAGNKAIFTGDFTVGAIITIAPVLGPAGTVITVAGRGFIHSPTDTPISIAIANIAPKNLTTIKTASDGTFVGQFVVPSSIEVSETHYMVSASDGIDNATTAGLTGGFKVTGTTKISVLPSSAQPGTLVTLEGVNFTAIVGTTVLVHVNSISSDPIIVATFFINATGGFRGSIVVPNLPAGAGYAINATDGSGLSAQTPFTIDIPSALNLAVSTDRSRYTKWSYVSITTTVTDAASGAPLQGATVNAKVYDTHGRAIWTSTAQTNSQGKAQFTYKLVFNAQMGIYQINVTATLTGYQQGIGQTTFYSLG